MQYITNEVCAEVYDIIQHLESELYKKIPQSFINFINYHRDQNFKVNIDYSKSINNQELQRETRVVLSLIYRDYICNEEERKILIEKDQKELKRQEEVIKEKYSPDNLFENKKIKFEKTEENKLIVYKENKIQKIFRKLKELFMAR